MESDKKEDKKPVVVIKKNGKGHGGHHGGAWKVAYADFVTAMMAFFLVMWLVNQSDIVKQNVGGYFRDPVGFSKSAGEGVLKQGAGIVESGSPSTPSDRDRQEKEKETLDHLEETGASIMEAVSSLPGLQKVSDRIQVEMTHEGLRIQMMESGDSTFFDLGSTELAPSGVSAVTAVGRVIATLDYDIIVEGHTDSRRYTRSKNYSNWELSSDRANTARRLLEQIGVAPERFVEIRAFADNELRYPDRPEDAHNRRIAIIVVNPFAETLGNSGASGLIDQSDPALAQD
jgi:chemotaxis protein MotB